jgi:hypothetical protein
MKSVETYRSEVAEETPESRLLKQQEATRQLTVMLEKLGPEAQAKAIETALPSILELIGLA